MCVVHTSLLCVYVKVDYDSDKFIHAPIYTYKIM